MSDPRERAIAGVDPARLEQLFAEASALSGARRVDYLDRACAGDRELRGALDSLLEHADACESDSGRGFLRGAPGGTLVEPTPIAAGTCIAGRYLIERVLGQGGMGVVYLARQTEPLRREVALKLIRGGMATPGTALRFDLERQTLALMNHPNIASVFDAGVTGTGEPYVVMEHVEGRPLTAFAREEGLDIDARLDLFVTVCDAVQHAHQKGILHRDLKPSNVLVAVRDGAPFAKVIDFGIAKAIDSRHVEGASRFAELTLASAFVGTPAYMSPEQFDRETDIDTRSDVYGLGATLYELLCGAAPFDSTRLGAASLTELLRIARDEEPRPPSSRAAGTRERASLRGDLDWITLKAMAKDRERRYVSAAALAEDIRRHRRSEPVEAGPPGAAYRVAKFVRRRRGVVAATAITALALLAGAGVALWQARVATEEAETARLVTNFLQDMYRSIDPQNARGETVTVLDALNATAPSLDHRFADKPLVQASLHWAVGGTYSSIGEFGPAERHLRRAADLLAEHRGPAHRDTLQASSDLAYSRKLAGALDEAERIARESLAVAERVQGPRGPQTLALKTTLASTLYDRKELDEAGRLFNEAHEAYSEEFGDRHRDTLMSITNLAAWMMESGQAAEAQAIFERALGLYEELYGPTHPGTVSTVSNLATACSRQGHIAEALPFAQRAYDDSALVLGTVHPKTLARGRNLVVANIQLRRFAEAEAVARAIVEASRAKHGAAHASTIASVEILVTALGLGGRLEDAEAVALAFHADVEREAGPVDPRTARTAKLLVELYDEWDKPAERAAWDARRADASAAEEP